MNRSDCLDVGLRLFGTWLFIIGIEHFFAVIDIKMRYFYPEKTLVQSYMWQSIAYFILGTLLFLCASRLVALVYPREIKENQES